MDEGTLRCADCGKTTEDVRERPIRGLARTPDRCAFCRSVAVFDNFRDIVMCDHSVRISQVTAGSSLIWRCATPVLRNLR